MAGQTGVTASRQVSRPRPDGSTEIRRHLHEKEHSFRTRFECCHALGYEVCLTTAQLCQNMYVCPRRKRVPDRNRADRGRTLMYVSPFYTSTSFCFQVAGRGHGQA